jgi:hypothetical protein
MAVQFGDSGCSDRCGFASLVGGGMRLRVEARTANAEGHDGTPMPPTAALGACGPVGVSRA